MRVIYRIRQAGEELEFSIEVDNRTNLPLAEVFFGIIGGQQGLLERRETESLVPGLNVNLAPDIFTNFKAGGYGGGNLGIRYDAAGFTYPGSMTMGWLEFYNPNHDSQVCILRSDPLSRRRWWAITGPAVKMYLRESRLG